MKIDIWRKTDESLSVPPERKVFTIRLTDDMVENLLCDMCWTDIREVRQHFWYKESGAIVKCVEMTFEEYIDKHRNELQGMNPFWMDGRIEFYYAWREKWKNKKPSL